LPLPEQDRIKEQSNYSNLHNYSQIQTNVSKQNMGFLSTKRTVKDNREQAVPYPAFGTCQVPESPSCCVNPQKVSLPGNVVTLPLSDAQGVIMA